MESAKLPSKPPQLPIVFPTDAATLLDDVRQAISVFRAIQDKVSSIDLEDASFTTVILPLAYAEGAYSDVVRVAAIMKSVSCDQAVREASREAIRLINDFEIESATREDIFLLMKEVEKQATLEPLDVESRYYLEKKLRRFIQTGLGIDEGPHRARFKDIQQRLSALSTECTKNFASESSGLWLSSTELNGLPLSTLAGLRKGGEKSGKVWLSMKLPDYNAAMKYVDSPAIRKQVFMAFENKCNVNAPLLKEMVLLRDEAARLLGFRNHAHATVQDRMANSPKFVESFLADLRSNLTPASRTEVQELLSLKRINLATKNADTEAANEIFLWDTAYYGRLMTELKFSFNQDKVSEYFPLDVCLPGMLQTFQHLLGLRFEALDTSTGISTWHKEVRVYQVWDSDKSDESFLGYLYFDLHPRDDKHNHNSHFNLQPGYTTSTESRRYPSSALVCNFTRPLPDRPSLLKHQECVTLFHELGHAIHSLVSQTRYSANHGTSVVRDFVEAPSKMLENWYWLPSQLKDISHHYSHLSPQYMEVWKQQNASECQVQDTETPPVKLPESMINSIVNSRFVNVATNQLRQVYLAMFDWKIHSPSSHDQLESLDLQKLYNRMRHEIVGISGPDLEYVWGNGHARFSHMWGAYDAGYYGYLLAFSYACDMYQSAFEPDPMNAEMGRRYRYELLQKGGSQREMTTLQDFLGRGPNNRAMMQRLGIGEQAVATSSL